MTKPLFVALSLSLAVPSFATSADDVFNAVVNDINHAVSKIVAAQARQSRERKTLDAQKAVPAAAPKCTPAQADEAYTALKRCQAAFQAAGANALFDAQGAPAKGFEAGRYMGGYPGGSGLVLLTTTDAYVYHEDCDICAEVTKCSLKDGKVTSFKAAHSVNCSDLAPEIAKKGTVVVFNACP